MKIEVSRHIGFALLTAVIFSSGHASGQDIATGKQLAFQWCAACHDVAGKTTSDAAPGFRSLAGDPNRNRNSLRLFLVNPHPPMPELTLSGLEIDDLIAYILSLENEE